MTIVRIIEWRHRTGSPTRLAGYYFSENGCRVEVSYNWADTGPPADLLYTPVPGLKKTEGVPLVTQFEGWGAISIMPGSKPSLRIKETFENSKVLLVDPNMHAELMRCGINQNTIMLPNPAPPITIPPKEHSAFTTFFPQGAWWIKNPQRIIESAKIVGKEEPKIKFVMPVGSRGGVWKWPLDWLEVDNIEFLPTLPYPAMLEQYAKADIVAPFSAAEILPWTVIEAFISGKPTIVDMIGKTQSVNRKYVEDMVSWFGTPSRIFDEKWREKYGSGEGDHYLHAGSAEELAKIILELYHDERRRLELGNNALEWIDAYSQNWKPKAKGKKILEMVGIV